jgi:hypothetical protein
MNCMVFSMFLHKSLWPRFLTLPFESFRFWLRIRGDILTRKSTPRIGDSGESTRLPAVSIFSKPLNKQILIVHYIPGLFFTKIIHIRPFKGFGEGATLLTAFLLNRLVIYISFWTHSVYLLLRSILCIFVCVNRTVQ